MVLRSCWAQEAGGWFPNAALRVAEQKVEYTAQDGYRLEEFGWWNDIVNIGNCQEKDTVSAGSAGHQKSLFVWSIIAKLASQSPGMECCSEFLSARMNGWGLQIAQTSDHHVRRNWKAIQK